MPATWLSPLQLYRVFGSSFLIGWAAGVMPGIFALPAGIGDVLTGLFAVPTAIALASGTLEGRKAAIAWNIFGLVDFTIAIGIGLAIAPGPLQLIVPSIPNGTRGHLSDGDDPGLCGAEFDPVARAVVAPIAPAQLLAASQHPERKMRHSLREILAAWACCGLVGFGALFMESRNTPTVAVYAGVHIPGPVGQAEPNLSIADEFADAPR